MKIALCKSHFAGPVSGADETLVTYAIKLHQEGHDVSVVLLYKALETDQYYLRLKRAGVTVSCVVARSLAYIALRGMRHLLSSVLFFLFLVPRSPEVLGRLSQFVLHVLAHLHYRQCRRYLATIRPDLLHVFTPDIGAALLIRAGHALGIPVLYQELGTPHHMPALGVYYRSLEKVLPLCAEVGALSPSLAAQWSVRFPFLKSVSVLPLMVGDVDRNLILTRREVGINGKTVFGYAARMEEGKGPLVLVDAFARLAAGSPAILRMAGIGPQLLDAKVKTRRLGLSDVCEFVGHYTEPLGRSTFMSSLDVFVLPSLAEGTPNSVIEAMAHSLPVIASEVGGIPDLLSPESGILVPPGNEQALAEAMRRLAEDSDLRASMGEAARARYLKLFSPDAVIPVLTSTYSRVASKRAPQPESTRSLRTAHPWEKIAPEF